LAGKYSKEMMPEEVKQRLEQGEKLNILDVRERNEWESGHIRSAKHIPLGFIRERHNELDPQKEIIVVCRSGNRSGLYQMEEVRMMEYDNNVILRLKRMDGQVRGILKMMEEGKNCKDVVTQLSAVRNAADKAVAYIVAVNLEQRVLEEKVKGKDTGKLVQEAVELMVKSR